MNLSQNELHRILVDHASDIISLHELDGTYVFCSPYCIDITGYNPSELIGKSPYEFIHPDDIEKVERLRTSIEKSNFPAFAEYRFKSKSGDFVWLQTSFRKIDLAGNSNKVIIATTRDFTERKELEEDLLKNQQMLKQMGRISNVGGWSIDIDTNTLEWTVEVYKIYEIDSGFIPNVDAAIDFFTDESKPMIAEALQRAIEYEEPYDLELEIITAKGNRRAVHAMGLPDHEHRRVYGTFLDITEQKALQQTQLRSSQLSALGEVAAGVAHEINNPINGVINYAQLLINKNDENDKSNQILERIIKEGSRISNIVQNLLNFAQQDRGDFLDLDLMNIVVEPINLLSQLLKSDGIRIEIEILDNLPKVYGNQMQLEQVVLNLLSNARYALNKKFPDPSNEKFIFIDAKSSNNQNGGKVQLRIKDYGCGIPKDHLGKIFNPFFTTKEAGVGIGLGMSLSHDILEKHKATIEVSSEVDKFTNITITFPVKSQ